MPVLVSGDFTRERDLKNLKSFEWGGDYAANYRKDREVGKALPIPTFENRLHVLKGKRRSDLPDMSNLLILMWRSKDATGEPEVEVKVPTRLAKWVPRLMKFVPKKTKEENWGHEIDFNAMAADIENLVAEAAESGQQELMTVKTKDAVVRISIEK